MGNLYSCNAMGRRFRLPLATHSHPGQSNTLLRLESLSSKCAKLHAVAAYARRAHSISACSHHIYMGVIHAHLIRGKSHIKHNANGEIATLAARLC